MNWLKRNLFLVGGGVVALILLGLAGFYLLRQQARNAQVTQELNQQIAEWQRLTSRNPSASEENITAAKKEVERLGALLQETRQYFAPVATYTNLDSAAFKSLLETTIFALTQQADGQGVTIPDRYGFTFDNLRTQVVFPERELVPLAYQVSEIQALCGVLFEARVHHLYRIRRVPTSSFDQGAGHYLTGSKVWTNTVTGAAVSPYEITFQGFTTELARVLRGLQEGPHCLMVKYLRVERAETGGAAPESPYATGVAVPMPGAPFPGAGGTDEDRMRSRYGLGPAGQDQRMRDRYGLGAGGGSRMQDRYGPAGGGTGRQPGGRYAPAPAPRPAYPSGTYGVATPRRTTETVLEEELLTVTLLIEVVRGKPEVN